MQLFRQRRVVIGRDNDGHVLKIFGGGTNHRRAADVYLLDGLFERDALAARDCLLKGVEVDDDEINQLDAVLFGGAHVLGVVAHGEERAVNARVERLDATVHHFGKAGHVRHVTHFDSGLAQSPRRPARAQNLNIEAAQMLCEFDEARLVGDAQERAADLPETFCILFSHEMNP